MIKSIIAQTGAEVNVEDDGSVSISAVDEEAVEKAVTWVEGLTHEVKPGEEYEGTVKRMMNFGAFVEILPGKEGLVHVSEMSTEYVKAPEDVVEIGQKVKVRVKEIDDMGRINLSMKFGENADKPSGGRSENGSGGDRGPRNNGGSSRGPRREGGSSRGPRRDFGGNSRGKSNFSNDRGYRSESSVFSSSKPNFSAKRRSSSSKKPSTYEGGRRDDWRA
jgi:polyribonucleotide nucleotidyltransferase